MKSFCTAFAWICVSDIARTCFFLALSVRLSSMPARGEFVGMKTENSEQSLNKNKENHSIFYSAPPFPVLRLSYPKLRSFNLAEIYSRMWRERVLGKTLHSLHWKRMQVKRRSKTSSLSAKSIHSKQSMKLWMEICINYLFIQTLSLGGKVGTETASPCCCINEDICVNIEHKVRKREGRNYSLQIER